MDIIVTTPKSQMANARLEAEQCREAGGGFYFRLLGTAKPKNVGAGDRIFYVENGAIRGFATIAGIRTAKHMRCVTTGQYWPSGWYVFMDAKTWKWIRPIRMMGFRGYRHLYPDSNTARAVEVVGGWLDPRPGNTHNQPREGEDE